MDNEPTILHEDSNWLVLNKPAGWHCAVAGKRSGSEAPDIESWLRSEFEWATDVAEAGLVHRLDQPTSGCVLIAKSIDAFEDLRAMIRNDVIHKRYLAIVCGPAPKNELFSLYFTSRYKRSSKITVREDGEERHRGRCRWHELGRVASDSLVEIELVGGGKRHQIRGGFAHFGAPLLGDTLYGGRAWHGHLALHAWKLEVRGSTVIAPPPTYWPKHPSYVNE